MESQSGVSVGESVGAGIGRLVGAGVGTELGPEVGTEVGAGTGTEVGLWPEARPTRAEAANRQRGAIVLTLTLVTITIISNGVMHHRPTTTAAAAAGAAAGAGALPTRVRWWYRTHPPRLLSHYSTKAPSLVPPLPRRSRTGVEAILAPSQPIRWLEQQRKCRH